MKVFSILFSLSLVSCGSLADNKSFSIFSDVLLRYESETAHLNLPDRERLRLVAHLGASYQWHHNWKLTGRLSTGLKNKQNVPAITIHKFNDQPSPDSDVFVDRLFISGQSARLSVKAGKIPWSSWQVTDLYWDRQLNPIGLHLDYRFNRQHSFSHMSAMPLDGNSGTIGQLHVSQWRYQFDYNDWGITVAPWLMLFNGQEQAEFAKRDTQLNNKLLNLSLQAKYGKWAFGIDVGRSLDTFSTSGFADFSDQKDSRAFEIKYGNLISPGNIQAHLRYLHLERFSAITEFAGNATQRFGTTNIAGWDLLVRRKMAENWWTGARFSHMSRLVGTPEKGNRFRIEVKYVF